MGKQQKRYQEMERYMSYVLIGDGVVFFLYLICAGLGIGWLKVIFAILAILVSGLCIVYLYLTQELLRVRSRWMSVGFAAVILCLLVSLLLNYPSPNPQKQNAADQNNSGSSTPTVTNTVYFIMDHYTI